MVISVTRIGMFIFFLHMASCETLFAQVSKVWALGDGEKVFRQELNHPDKKENNCWDGKKVRLKGLYNEVLAFQVIAESGNLPGAVEISISAPLHKLSGKAIGANTLLYGPSGTIEIYAEHYLQVKDSTQPNWYYGSPAARPKKMTGWIPDALIPLHSSPGIIPLQIAPRQNQGFWVDIHLPRDQQQFPAGLYVGSIQVYEKGKLFAQMPLEINLLPNYLPDENRTHVWLFTEGCYEYFPGLSKPSVDALLKFEGHRHRVDVAGGFEVNGSVFKSEKMDLYKPWLDGSGFTAANGYRGNGEGIGEHLFPIGMYGSPVLGFTKDSVQQQAALWVDWFSLNAPAVKYFWYITDEPPAEKYSWIRERSNWIHKSPGNAKQLPVFTTKAYDKELAGVIDIWAGYDGVDLEQMDAIKKSGGDHWFYNGNRPRYGSVILEGAAIDFRVNSWILYKYNIGTWFIWNGTNWQHNGQGPKKHLHQNMFQNPLTFINDQMEFGNGDGILFYPGHMPFYPTEDRGLNAFLPSIRLKNIRRGQQDAAIMWMAEQKVGREKVIEIISKVLPKALSEVSMKDVVPWSERGNEYDLVRDALLKLL